MSTAPIKTLTCARLCICTRDALGSFLVDDLNVLVPNVPGVLLGAVQVLMYAFYSRHTSTARARRIPTPSCRRVVEASKCFCWRRLVPTGLHARRTALTLYDASCIAVRYGLSASPHRALRPPTAASTDRPMFHILASDSGGARTAMRRRHGLAHDVACVVDTIPGANAPWNGGAANSSHSVPSLATSRFELQGLAAVRRTQATWVEPQL